MLQNLEEIWFQAAESPEGITLTFKTEAALTKMRARLYRLRQTTNARLSKEWANQYAIGYDPEIDPAPETLWDNLIINKTGPRTLWIGPMNLETLEIEKIEGWKEDE